LAPRPFAGCQQCECKQPAAEDADAGTYQARLDRVAHQEEATERKRQAADPDHPTGAELLLETRTGYRRRRWGWRQRRWLRGDLGPDGIGVERGWAGCWRRGRGLAGRL